MQSVPVKRTIQIEVIFDVEYASLNYFVMESGQFKWKFKKSGFQDREDWTKLETEERSIAALCEHRKVRLSSIFDVEYASLNCFVMESGQFKSKFKKSGFQDR
ncbi:hypothetical protein B1748_34050 [Paenibacillus sp. MY03]|nr:hypothetical protein B1748_34050 [Paenibacillus sp. MY03]